MLNQIQMVATDLDGTLLNSHLLLSDKNCRSLRYLKKRGIQLVLCTGRPFKGIKHLIDEIGLDANDYTISYNGSLVQTCDGSEILHQAQISAKAFSEMSQFFAKYGLGCHAMTMDGIFTYNQAVHPLTVRESYLGHLPLTVLASETWVAEPIIKIMAVGDGQVLDRAVKDLADIFGNHFSLNKSEDFYLEIMQKGDNKAAALSLLLDKMDLDRSQLLAFGNNLNDLEMLELAGIGVAVDNAVPDLKKVSDYITSSNDADGVAEFIHYLKKESERREKTYG